MRWTRRFLAVALAALALTASAGDLAIQAGALFDGTGENLRREVTIRVHDDRIVAVESGFVSPPGAEVVDLREETVLPGFIDCHVHIAAKLPSRVNATEDWLTHSDIDRAFDGVEFVQAMLQQGFTGARDVGGGDGRSPSARAIDDGKMPGRGSGSSLEPLGPTAGHGDPRSGLDPMLVRPGWDYGASTRRGGAASSARAPAARGGPDQADAVGRHCLDRRRPAPAVDDRTSEIRTAVESAPTRSA